jgi:hypothetical protein
MNTEKNIVLTGHQGHQDISGSSGSHHITALDLHRFYTFLRLADAFDLVPSPCLRMAKLLHAVSRCSCWSFPEMDLLARCGMRQQALQLSAW